MVFRNIQLSTTTRVMMTQHKEMKRTRAEDDAGLPCEAGSLLLVPPLSLSEYYVGLGIIFHFCCR